MAVAMPGPGLGVDEAAATLAASPQRGTILALLVFGFGLKQQPRAPARVDAARTLGGTGAGLGGAEAVRS